MTARADQGPRPPLRGVLVGCGYISTQQLKAWRDIPEVEIVAVVDVEHAKAEAQSRAFDIPEAYTDLPAALSAVGADFVDIATPPESHLALVRTAVFAGAHVLCQKPPAPSLAQLKEMIGLADQAGQLFVVNENMRFQPWFRRIKTLIGDDAIGDPFYARFLFRSRASLPEPSFGPQPYFAQMPRLLVYEMGIHVLDTMRYLFGEPTWLVATEGKASQEIAGEDHVVALLTYPDLTVVMDGSWASIPTWTTESRVSWVDVTVEGPGGTIHLGIDGRLRVLSDGYEAVTPFTVDTVHGGFVGMQQDFIDALLGRKTAETEGTSYLRTMELVFGVYDAASRQDLYHLGVDIARLQ